MGTLVICLKKECMYAKKRKDGLFQCSCTTIQIDADERCDSYMILPVPPDTGKILTEIVDEIIDDLPEPDKLYIRSTRRENLIQFHHGFGTNIRNEYKLWTNPVGLLKDMGLAKDAHADDVSMEIIKAVWKKLKE